MLLRFDELTYCKIKSFTVYYSATFLSNRNSLFFQILMNVQTLMEDVNRIVPIQMEVLGAVVMMGTEQMSQTLHSVEVRVVKFLLSNQLCLLRNIFNLTFMENQRHTVERVLFLKRNSQFSIYNVLLTNNEPVFS